MITRADAFLFVMGVDKEIAEALGEEPLAAEMMATAGKRPGLDERIPGSGSIGTVYVHRDPSTGRLHRSKKSLERRNVAKASVEHIEGPVYVDLEFGLSGASDVAPRDWDVGHIAD